MLYLEDYLEMIEHLPQELRDRFTEMRELDLSVQNNMDDLEKRVKVLFNEWKRNPNDLPPTADLEFDGIKKEYYKTLEDQDEKVVLANQMYELVDRYLRRLDTELHKFKCELEADNKGITELLEKRSLELDTPITSTTSSQKENRYERYTSSRPREKRRSDSCQSAGGVTYPEKRPHLSHSLSLSDQRVAVSATNGNNVLLASQLQQNAHGQSANLHGIAQSHQQAAATNCAPSNSHHHNSHATPVNNFTNNNNSSINLTQQSLSTSSAASSSNTLGANLIPCSTSAQQHVTSNNPSFHTQSTLSSPSSIPQQLSNVSSVNVSSNTTSNGGGGHSTPNSAGGSGGGYTLVTGGAGPAIAAAASQAIAATQKMQQGRRTPSLKASYEAINSSAGSGGLMKVNDLAIGRELAGAAQTAIQAIQHDSNKKKAKKSSSHHSSSSSSSARHSMGASSSSASATLTQAQQHMELGEVDGGYMGGVDMGAAVDDMGVVGAADDLAAVNGEYIDTYDPNEPRYCLCNQVSYGDMVACDNEDCPSEWFHYPCVGITAPPKGKWYCPQCTSSMRRRGSRKN